MKKALKLAALTAALALVLSSFSACDIFDKKPDTSTTAPVSTTEENGETLKTDDIEKEETTEEEITEEKTTEKVEVDSVDTVLNLIKDYPIGTAGSTAKSVDIAIRLINFTENNDDKDSAEADIKAFLSGLSDVEKEIFAQCLDEIDYMARKLLSGSTSSIKQYIEESSEKFDDGNYSTEKYEEIFDIIKNS